jgi:hypothetical protein
MRLRSLSILVLVFVLPLLAASAYPDSLGPDLSTFAVLGAAAVTNASGTGAPTIITGNLGSATAVTGFPPGIVIGGTINPPNVAAAQGNLTTAVTFLGGLGPGSPILAGGLTGATLTPNVYSVTSTSFDLTGALTLDATGNPNGSWVFLMSSSLITGSSATVNLIGFGPDNSVYWIVPSFTTLGDSTAFAGNILAHDLIAFDPGAQDLCGRALSQTSGVTFAGAAPATTVGRPNLVGGGCGSSGGLNGGPGPSPVPTPEPSMFALLSSGLAIGLLKLLKLR